MPDGYVVADPGTDPEAVFNQPGVRHVAILENGELFAAFDGDQPCAGQLLLNSDEALPWWWHKVRTVQPSGPEAFYLFTSEGFDGLKMGVIAAASRLHTGNVLVQTNGEELEGALWGSRAERYLDERLVSA
jgi:hypothetical protein